MRNINRFWTKRKIIYRRGQMIKAGARMCKLPEINHQNQCRLSSTFASISLNNSVACVDLKARAAVIFRAKMFLGDIIRLEKKVADVKQEISAERVVCGYSA